MALLHVLILGSALFGLAVMSLVVSRTDQMISNNIVNGMKAFWIASGGADAGKAWLADGNTGDACIGTASCLMGNLLDGAYTVTISRYANLDPRLRIRSVGTGPNNARKVVDEIVLAPFFEGDDGVIQIDGDRLPADFEDPRFGRPGMRIPDWTIDGRNHDPATLLLDEATCAAAPPVGGNFDQANTAMENELNDLRCRIVQRANECCLQDGTTSDACQIVPGFCEPVPPATPCDLSSGLCADGTCTIGSCYAGGCATATCIPAGCPIIGCSPGSCAANDASCASGTCVVDTATCQPGACGDSSCAPGSCAVGTCTAGSCDPGDPYCAPGWCKNNNCSYASTCHGNNCEPARCAVGTCTAGATGGGGSYVPGTCGIVAGSCNAVACPAGSSCASAACTIGQCAADADCSGGCAAGSCTASCSQGGSCGDSPDCVTATCSLPGCERICEDPDTCEKDPGLFFVRGDQAQPRYQTPYWTDTDLSDGNVNIPPGTWATDCSAPATNCCKSMDLEPAELRAIGNPPAPLAEYPDCSQEPVPSYCPAPLSYRGPLTPDTPADPSDLIPVNYLNETQRQELSLKIDGILKSALAAPEGMKTCLTEGHITGETPADLGDLANPRIVFFADTAEQQNDKMKALSLSPPCSGAGPLNNVTIDGNSVFQGAGILIVPRGLIVKDATFVWKGLVVVLERGRIETWDNACGGIWGGVLMQKDESGNDARLDLDKNTEQNAASCPWPNNAFSINYSCQALDMANELSFRTLAWSEVFGE